MYFVVVTLLTVVAPIVSIAIEDIARPHADLQHLLGRWFVFWAIGVRLLLAGISQATRPAYTASGILGISDPKSEKVVAELGYANISMGVIGLLSVLRPTWIAPAALAGGLFLGLAGVKHALTTDRSAKENLAMATDLFVAAMLAIYFVSLALA